MILKSSERSWATKLAIHLTSTDDNERVRVRSSRNVITGDDVFGALKDMEVIAKDNRCIKHMHHAMMNPGESLTDDEWDQCWEMYEQEFGLEEQPYIEVEHLKEGRIHRHRVYHRIRRDAPAVTFDHSKRRNEYLSRVIEHELGHDLTVGKHNLAVMARLREDGLDQVADWMEQQRAHEVARPVAEKDHQDHQIAKRTEIETAEIRKRCSTAWAATTTGTAFRAALFGQNLLLARGDKRPFVVVDEAGIHHSLPVRLPRGINTPEVRERLADIDPNSLPGIEQAREQQLEMARQHEKAMEDRRQDAEQADPDLAAAEAPETEPDIDKNMSDDDQTCEEEDRSTEDDAGHGSDDKPQIDTRPDGPEALSKAAAEHLIRDIWDRSATGHDLKASLGAEGLVLARGHRNDFMVIDQAGERHSLNRRIGEKIAPVRDRLADLDMDELPSIEEARQQQLDLARQMQELEEDHAQRGSDEPHQIDADRGDPEQEATPPDQMTEIDSPAPEISPEEQRRRDKARKLQQQRQEQEQQEARKRRKAAERRRQQQLLERRKQQAQRRKAAAKARALREQIEQQPQERPGLLVRANTALIAPIRDKVVGWVKDRLGGLFGRSTTAEDQQEAQELAARQEREEQRRKELARQARDKEKDKDDTGYEIIDLDEVKLSRKSRERLKERDKGGFDRTREDDDDDRW